MSAQNVGFYGKFFDVASNATTGAYGKYVVVGSFAVSSVGSSVSSGSFFRLYPTDAQRLYPIHVNRLFPVT